MSSQPVPLQPEAEEETRESPSTRSSDRVYLEIPITLRGSDSEGRNFSENTHTLVISRRGAKIISRQPLVPRQLLAIRCNKTGLDAAALVVGPIMGDEEGCHFALAFLHQEEDFWGVSFPLLDGRENAAGRIFLECSTCKAQQVAHLDVFELEVLLANDSLTRPCHRCNRSGLWVRTAPEEERTPPLRAVPDVRSKPENRKSAGISLKVDVCIRHPKFGDEMVITENVSRGGFRFLGHKDYPLGSTLEAALPYRRGAVNIFTPARVVHRQAESTPGLFAFEVEYLASVLAPSLTGFRITHPK